MIQNLVKQCFCVFFIAAMVLATSACTPKPRSSEDRQKSLENAMKEMKGPEVDTIKSSLLKQVDSAMKAGDTRLAEGTLKQVLDKDAKNPELLLKYADIQRKNSKFDDAIKSYDAVLAINETSLDAKEGKALSLLGKGELIDAGNRFGEVIKADPTRWRSLNAVGILFAMKNMSNEANAYFKEALLHSNNSASVLNNIALTKAFVRDFDNAIATFLQARSKLEADSLDIKQVDLNLALTYGIMGRMDDAQKVSEKYLTESQLYNNLGFYALLSKDSNLAKTYLNMALTQSPKYYEKAWNNLELVSGGSNENNATLPKFQVR